MLINFEAFWMQGSRFIRNYHMIYPNISRQSLIFVGIRFTLGMNCDLGCATQRYIKGVDKNGLDWKQSTVYVSQIKFQFSWWHRLQFMSFIPGMTPGPIDFHIFRMAKNHETPSRFCCFLLLSESPALGGNTLASVRKRRPLDGFGGFLESSHLGYRWIRMYIYIYIYIYVWIDDI